MSNPNDIARDIYGALNAALAEYDLDAIDIVAVYTDVLTLIDNARTATVRDARSSWGGATWEKIGTALRVSKQAAQQRYGRVAGTDAPLSS